MKTVTDRQPGREKRGTPAYEQDQELAARVVEGDKEALVRLIDRHIGPVYKYLSRRLGPGNEALVGEVVEAAFEEAFRHLQPYARRHASLPLRLRLIRLANKHLAKRRRRALAGMGMNEVGGNSSSEVVAADQEENSEGLTALRREMSRLPMRHQAALALALFEEMPPEEMAAALRTTPSGAMHLLRGALKRVGKRRRNEGFY